jgi:alpha/beta hydrolase family protein
LKYSGALIRRHGSLRPGARHWTRRLVLAFRSSPCCGLQGHDVYAPMLTGLGSSCHLLHDPDRILLHTHVKDVTNTLFDEDLSEVVLVGHSYGGMVITGVAVREPRRLTGSTGLPRCLPASRRGKQIPYGHPIRRKCIYFYRNGLFYPCCGMQLRRTPTTKDGKERIRQRKTHQGKKRVLNSGFLQVQPKPTKDVRTRTMAWVWARIPQRMHYY